MSLDQPRFDVLSREGVAGVHVVDRLIEVHADRANLPGQRDHFGAPFAIEGRPHIRGRPDHAPKSLARCEILGFAKSSKAGGLAVVDAQAKKGLRLWGTIETTRS